MKIYFSNKFQVCEEKNLSQSSQKMEESSSEEKQLPLKVNFSPQDIIKE